MVKCGIRKYDELPARIGWVDVDALRFWLSEYQSQMKKIKNRNNDLKMRIRHRISEVKFELDSMRKEWLKKKIKG